MKVPTILAKLISLMLAVLTPTLSAAFGFTGNLVVRRQADAVQSMQAADGFITGVCHPEPEYQKIKAANIGWIRVDIPFPFDGDGKINTFYQSFKNEMKDYVRHGIKVMAVTPNPYTYLTCGLDIRKEEDVPKIQEIARFYVRDLKGIVGLLQVANEMGIDRFTKPFTLREAAKFIGVQLEAMYPVRSEIRIGYNVGGLGVVQLPPLMRPYSKFVDYVGVDLYFGSFENIVKSIDTYTAVLKEVYAVTRKPLILTEFGYIGCGEPKTKAEKQKILRQYGVHSEAQARRNIDAFISKLPERICWEFETYYSGKSAREKANLLFRGEFANHIYRELSKGVSLRGYPHTSEGQAKFFADLIPKIRSLDYCVGAFVYMWNDADHCYVCGQKDCPVETGWGIVDAQGKEKPAYYAVQKAFAAG